MAVAVEQGVQGFADGGATGVQVRGELRVGQQLEDRVGDQVGRRFDAGAVEGDELVQHLGVVEPRGVGDEPGGDVVAGLLARQCDEVADRAGVRISFPASAFTPSKTLAMPSAQRRPLPSGQPGRALRDRRASGQAWSASRPARPAVWNAAMVESAF
ncbi:hypothetical protein ACFWHW_11490 [Streptomyces pharetrae]|uniref:hypothetical protein n=1 Tax=Streptomyces pharetrae TaxID=291370 RepID=UPI00364BD8D6